MDIAKLALGIALIAGYLALRLGWSYRRDTKRATGKKSAWEEAQYGLMLALGVIMLFGGIYFIWWSLG